MGSFILPPQVLSTGNQSLTHFTLSANEVSDIEIRATKNVKSLRVLNCSRFVRGLLLHFLRIEFDPLFCALAALMGEFKRQRVELRGNTSSAPFNEVRPCVSL